MQRYRYKGLLAVLSTALLALALVPLPGFAQLMPGRTLVNGDKSDPPGSEFHFVRLIYGGTGRGERFGGRLAVAECLCRGLVGEVAVAAVRVQGERAVGAGQCGADGAGAADG